LRIIRGKFKTRRYKVPKNFPSRPTTDFAKEGLFNILENQRYLEDLNILDLCSGSGNISVEFLSREAGTVTAVDKNYNCVRHLHKVIRELGCEKDINIVKSDIVKYIESCNSSFDIIFADPPYAYKEYEKLIETVFERNLLNENGILIIEHGKETDLSDKTHFDILRKYGNVWFSFFKLKSEEL
jgi:16S rRNA (guanine(966)-N(2))-methyltransferase RsmD